MKNIWAWRLAIISFLFFTMVSLGSAVTVALTNVDWIELSAQSRFLVVIAVAVNWGNTMMAFLSKQAKQLEADGGLDVNGTIVPPDSTVKTTITTATATEVTKTP